ncbi:hypothetical protein L810_7214 [Burkholderia sp. AU4i]|nr:hypothetical protein L810_7214 [Burkholderia sp. AU4i]
MGRGHGRARAAGLRVRDGREGGKCAASEEQTFGRDRAEKGKVCHLVVVPWQGESERLSGHRCPNRFGCYFKPVWNAKDIYLTVIVTNWK